MNLTTDLLGEAKREYANTRLMLTRIPPDQLAYQPHAKSTRLGPLATHIAEIPRMFIYQVLMSEELDFGQFRYVPPVVDTLEELLDLFDFNLDRALAALEGESEEALQEAWTMRRGEQVMMVLPRKAVVRTMGLNHMIHHRAQLSVYLRLLEVPVPGMYGPSADERAGN